MEVVIASPIPPNAALSTAWVWLWPILVSAVLTAVLWRGYVAHWVPGMIGSIHASLWYLQLIWAGIRHGEDVFGQFVAATRIAGTQRPATVRTTFMDSVLPTVKPAAMHTHGVSAAARSAGSLLMERVGALLGKSVYYVQMAASDQRLGRLGSRSYYWVKDLNVGVRSFDPPPGCILAMVDVDQYLDMHDLLLEHDGNVLLYTFQPKRAAAVRADYSYCFDRAGRVQYDVTGGARYEHHVWDWGCDNLLVKTGWLFGARANAYLVDRKMVDEDHEVVCLTSLGRWEGIPAMVVGWLHARRLVRLAPVVGQFVRIALRGGGAYVSTAFVGELLEASVPAAVDAALASTARISGIKLTVAQVQSKTGLGVNESTLLTEYHRSICVAGASVVYAPQDAVRHYQFGRAEDIDHDAKIPMRAFMQPIMLDSFVPVRSVSNDRRGVESRVTSVAMNVTLTPLLAKFIDEFARLVVPDALLHLGVPADLEEVWDKQARPSQRRILEEADHALPFRQISSFMKAESYSEVKDPRLISTINGCDKRDYSRFCYAFAAHMKMFEWYAFGKTPFEIAFRVAAICELAVCGVSLTDLSRCDGRISEVLRDLERIVMMRFFGEQWADVLIELMRSQYQMRATTSMGVKYRTGWARVSGSPETSIFNSLANAFIAYMCHRMTYVNGAYRGVEEAWQRLGVYGGDDGLTADVNSRVYENSAKSVGQKLTCDVVPRGALGVKFLAREYSHLVWFGEPSNCADVRRQVVKFHMSTIPPGNVTPIEKLVEKLRALALTDRNTPILGDFVARAMQLGVDVDAPPQIRELVSWWAGFAAPDQFPNDNVDGWMGVRVLDTMPDFDYPAFRQWLTGCVTPLDLLSPPLFACPSAPIVPRVINDDDASTIVVVDGELVHRPVTSVAALAVSTRPAASPVSQRGRGGRQTRPEGPRTARGRGRDSGRGGARIAGRGRAYGGAPRGRCAAAPVRGDAQP